MRSKRPAGDPAASRVDAKRHLGFRGIARWSALLLVAFLFSLAAPTSAAQATPPELDLGASTVLDQVGALSPTEHGRVDGELRELSRAHGIDLYAVFVDRFTDPADSQQWTDAVAKRNGLGKAQYVLAVATESRQFYTSADNAGPLNPNQLDALEAAAKPFLTTGDYAGAVSAAAASAARSLAGTAAPSVSPSPTQPSAEPPSTAPAPTPQSSTAPTPLSPTHVEAPTGWKAVLNFLIGLGVIGGLVWWLVRRAGRGKRAAQQRLRELEAGSASVLVRTDEAMRTASQELDFARAQFGDEANAAFADALGRAKGDLDAAFARKQQLDDAAPDTTEQQETWHAEIVDLCGRVQRELDVQAERLASVRMLAQQGPEHLERLRGEAAAAAAALGAAEPQLADLQQRFTGVLLDSVRENLSTGRNVQASAARQLEAAGAALETGDSARAAVGLRAVQDANAQIQALVAAIGDAGRGLEDGVQRALALIADLEGDLVEAIGIDDPDGRLAGGRSAVQSQIAAARDQLSRAPLDPLAVVGSLDAANTAFDALIAERRDAQVRAERAQQQLEYAIQQASAQVTAAENLIATRRGIVGSRARTRNAEASAALEQAFRLQESDLESSGAYAERARQLAAQALGLAQRDVDADRREQRAAAARAAQAASAPRSSAPPAAAFGGFSSGGTSTPPTDEGSRGRRGGGHF